MKLVICYSTGSYEAHYEHIYTIEAESKESFISDFYAAFYTWAVRKELEDKARTMLNTVRHLGTDMTKTSEWSIWSDYVASDNRKYVDSLIIDGHEFAMIETYTEVPGGYVITGMPDIYTLDEWFEEKRPRKVA